MTTPEKVGTGDREWLYEEVLKFISTPGRWEVVTNGVVRPTPIHDIYNEFAPVSGYTGDRGPWGDKIRVQKRSMLKAALRRLIVDGRIKIDFEEFINLNSMDGQERRKVVLLRKLLGSEFDGRVQHYSKINILEGIVQALEIHQ